MNPWGEKENDIPVFNGGGNVAVDYHNTLYSPPTKPTGKKEQGK